VGSLLLGAGTQAQWIVETPRPFAVYLLAVGALGLIYGLWVNGRDARPVRVGDAGLAFEQGGEIQRFPWYDMKRIRIQGGAVVIEHSRRTVKVHTVAHAAAAAILIEEAARRIPDRLEISPNQKSALPKVDRASLERLRVMDLQVVGRHCRASDEPIKLEEDARLCPRCGALYSKEHLPQACVECGGAVAGRELRVA
jgi:hypothetical protein